MTDTALIQASDVGLSFAAETVLQDMTFSIGRGEFVTVLGPSGCGKSTLLRLVAGLLEPTTGAVSLGGTAPAAARREQERIGIVFQDPVLLPWRTVQDNIRLPLELTGEAESVPIGELLELVGLTKADAAKRPAQLSGGMRMRVSLARALVTRPSLFLLDEPFAALDDILRQQLNEELLRIRQQQKCTTLFVTHNVAEAVFLSQRILVLSQKPARLIADLQVPFAYPRETALRGEPDFARLVQTVSEHLRGTA